MSLFRTVMLCLYGILNASIVLGDDSDKFSKLQIQLDFLLDERIKDRQEFEGGRQKDHQLIEKLMEDRQKDHQLIENLMEDKQKARNEIAALRTHVHHLEQHAHDEAKRFVLPGQAYGGNGVAFTACVGVGDLKNLGAHQTIVFDRSITNQGNAYHTTTGIFTAPVNGIYVFHLSAMNRAGQYAYYNIVKDGVSIDDMLTDGTGDQSWESASEMWALRLSIGSEVWIQIAGAGEVHGGCHTMFTGFLLNETET